MGDDPAVVGATDESKRTHARARVNNATGSVCAVVTNLGVVRGQPDRLQSETRSAFVAQTPELLIHDLDGNLVRDGRWMYYWDAENRLTKVITVAGPSSSFRRMEWKYDALGRRVRQTSYVLTNGVWQVVEDLKLVSDPVLFGRHVAELNATNNSVVRAYIWGLDLSETLDGAGGVGGLLWVRVAGGPAAGTHFVTYDGNGNVWNLVSASTGTETARYDYGPFGEPLRLSGPAGRFDHCRFSTKRTEDFSGLALYEHRAYSPSLGRRLSRDPIGREMDCLHADPCDVVDALAMYVLGHADWNMHKARLKQLLHNPDTLTRTRDSIGCVLHLEPYWTGEIDNSRSMGGTLGLLDSVGPPSPVVGNQPANGVDLLGLRGVSPDQGINIPPTIPQTDEFKRALERHHRACRCGDGPSTFDCHTICDVLYGNVSIYLVTRCMLSCEDCELGTFTWRHPPDKRSSKSSERKKDQWNHIP